MSKIEELIQQYCPDGVEYVKLGEVADYIRGITFSKTKELPKGGSGWGVLRANNINLETSRLIFDDIVWISKEVKVKKEQHLYKGDILICAGSGSKQHIGKVAYISEDLEYIFGGFMGVVRCNDKINQLFLFHILRSFLFRKYLDQALKSSTINNLNSAIMRDFPIPIPPLEVQEEIVRILDKFSLLTAELEAELELRRKQYDFYRNQLLSFDSDSDTVQWKKLGEIGIFYGGLSGKSKKDFVDGNAKFISYKNIFNNIALDIDTQERVKISPQEKQNTIEYADVLFTGSSETPDECGMSSVLTQHTQEKLYLNSFCFGFRLHNKKLFLPDFLKHLFRSSELRAQIKKTANGTTRFNVSKAKFALISIPIPPLSEQQRIVDILDRFDALVNDLSAGLPAEIEARRKQYEYYRDTLLTFKRKAE